MNDSLSNGSQRAAYWISLAIIAVVIGAIALQAMRPSDGSPPAFVVRQIKTVTQSGSFDVHMEVRNTGAMTAENVQVQATLTLPDDQPPETGEQVVRFLAGGARQVVVFLFSQDPASGKLDVRVTSYAQP